MPFIVLLASCVAVNLSWLRTLAPVYDLPGPPYAGDSGSLNEDLGFVVFALVFVCFWVCNCGCGGVAMTWDKLRQGASPVQLGKQGGEEGWWRSRSRAQSLGAGTVTLCKLSAVCT